MMTGNGPRGQEDNHNEGSHTPEEDVSLPETGAKRAAAVASLVTGNGQGPATPARAISIDRGSLSAVEGAQRAAVFAAAAAAPAADKPVSEEAEPQGRSLEAELQAAAAARPRSVVDELTQGASGEAHSELRELAAVDVTDLLLELAGIPQAEERVGVAVRGGGGGRRGDGASPRVGRSAEEEAIVVAGVQAAPAAASGARPRPLYPADDGGDDGLGEGKDGDGDGGVVGASAGTTSRERLVAVLNARLFDGQGEALIELGPLDADKANAAVACLSQVVEADLGGRAQRVHTRDSGRARDPRVRAVALVRLPPSDDRHLNLRVAVIGNVDAGKSTLVGVLVGGALDNGRGSARLKVLRHKHEAESGRTSSISEDQHLGFDQYGRVMNAQAAANPALSDAAATAAGPACAGSSRASNWQEVVQRSSKVVSFIDLAGHEKYLKTTMFGMTAHDPDYGLVVVGANHGVTRMTKEHLGVAIALNVPVLVVVTKADLAPANVLRETLAQLMRLLKLPGARKKPFVVRGMDDVVVASRAFREGFVAPIFTVSNVSGVHMELLHAFINLLPSRKHWSAQSDGSVEFLIDQFFNVPGIGTVVAGTLVSGLVSTGQVLQLGPDSSGAFRPVVVKSIHHMRVPATRLLPGQSGAFLMRAVKRKEHLRSMGLRKGMVLVDEHAKTKAVWRFRCDVLVLHSSTTMRCNYQPVLHVRNVRQSARITRMDREVLRTGTKASIEFEFLFRPEFIQVGSRLIFREGKTKGIGNITAVDTEPPTGNLPWRKKGGGAHSEPALSVAGAGAVAGTK